MVLSLHLQGTSGLLQCSSASMDEGSRGVNKPTPQDDAERRLNTEMGSAYWACYTGEPDKTSADQDKLDRGEPL